MKTENIEIKSKCNNTEKIKKILEKLNARFIGIDYQIDTYFNVKNGRLKLREGNIENALIFYKRENIKQNKYSEVILYPTKNSKALKQILTETMGVKIIVKKQREIYFIENVKFHIDKIDNLGEFIEIEAQNSNGKYNISQLKAQCDYYIKLFDLKKENFIETSYSDLLINKQ